MFLFAIIEINVRVLKYYAMHYQIDYEVQVNDYQPYTGSSTQEPVRESLPSNSMDTHLYSKAVTASEEQGTLNPFKEPFPEFLSSF